MDDTVLRTLADRLEYLRGLEKRREESPGRHRGPGEADGGAVRRPDRRRGPWRRWRSLYRPYGQEPHPGHHRRERGLEPLATLLFAQRLPDPCGAYVDPTRGGGQHGGGGPAGAGHHCGGGISQGAGGESCGEKMSTLRELLLRRGAGPCVSRRGGGHRLPPVLRLPAAPPGSGPPDPGY